VLKNKGDFLILNYVFENIDSFLFVTTLNNLNYFVLNNKIKIEYRYSYDNINFSLFEELKTNNITDIKSSTKIYFDIKLTCLDNLDIEYEFNPNDLVIKIDEKEIPPPVIKLTGNKTIIDTNLEIKFKPYDLNQSKFIEKQISYSLNSIYGIDVLYLKANPNKRAEDVILFEYTLTSVDSPVCLKVLLQDNTIEEFKLQYINFGINFESDVIINIDKSYFQSIFGPNSAPQKGDIVYIQSINRLYEIKSSYIEKGIMFQDLYFVCALTKYSPKASRKESEEVKNFIDSITKSAEEFFNEKQKEEELNITKPQNFSNHIDDTNIPQKLDPNRYYIDTDVLINLEKIELKNILISEFNYETYKVFKKDAILYKAEFTNDLKNIGFSCWIANSTEKLLTKSYKFTSFTFNSVTKKLTINLNYNLNYLVGDLVEIFNPIMPLYFYGSINTITHPTPNSTQLIIEFSQPVLNYLSQINWTSINYYEIRKIEKKNLLYSYNATNGIIINLISRNFIELILNTKSYIFRIKKNIDLNEWIGIILNVSKEFNQIGFSCYNISNGDLVKINSELIPNENIDLTPSNQRFKIIGSNGLKETNIRLFNKIIDEEIEYNILTEFIVRNTYNAIIVDNAIPPNRLPFVSDIR
jgi:hypothetical protein